MTIGRIERFWERPTCDFDGGPGERVSIGLVVLGPDRVGLMDTECFLVDVPGLAVFSTRIPFGETVTPGSLSSMRDDISAAAAVLVPGSRLDVLGFCCTSGTAAIGSEQTANALRDGGRDIPTTTPLGAAVKALHAVQARRICLLTPYLEAASNLVADFIENNGVDILRAATFDLAGDRDMNRVNAASIERAAAELARSSPDAVFISCTALRTSHLVDRLEKAVGCPVLTSNQVMAWDCLRLARCLDRLSGRGILFTL